MKAGEEPYVIFIPDFGLVRVKGRDFLLETNPKKLSMWVTEAGALNGIELLRPEDPVKRMLMVNAQAVPLSEGFRRQRAWEAFQDLFNAYKVTLSDAEKEVFYEPIQGSAAEGQEAD